MKALLALLPVSSLAGYQWHAGYIPVGNDVATLPPGTTITAAQAFCSANALCAAFTYLGPAAGPSAGTVYFKNATGWQSFLPNSTSPWSTFSRTIGPCDILLAGGTPCVAAHSVARALFADFSGPLFTVNRTSDGALLEVGVVQPSGAADAAAVDAFCGRAPCVIQRIWDQSGRGNHLNVAPPGGAHNAQDSAVNATRQPGSLAGHKVYAAYFEGGMGYRCDNTSGVATGNDPETLYMVTSGQHFNDGCCFDYGNAETNNHDDGVGTMEAVYWGSNPVWGRGLGSGPWVMADLENGLWGGNEALNPGNVPLTYPFVTAMVKGGTNGFALKAADATQGKLQSMFDGPRPPGYQPMRKQGAVVLGIGGDNSDQAIGTFWEGVITQGFTTDAVDDAVQQNIVSAGYGK